MIWNILFTAPRINTIVALPVGEHNNYDMEYIVHGSKNQDDSKLKLTLSEFFEANATFQSASTDLGHALVVCDFAHES